MPDIATRWSPEAALGDWAMAGPDLAVGPDIVTAVILSLFTDRLAAPDDVIPDGTTDPRGWWGDEDPQFPLGSRLWLLDRAKRTDETLRNARIYAEEALAWMVADRVAARVGVTAEWIQRGALVFLGLTIQIFKPAGGAADTLRFESAWNGVF